jgi:hypothetical protein
MAALLIVLRDERLTFAPIFIEFLTTLIPFRLDNRFAFNAACVAAFAFKIDCSKRRSDLRYRTALGFPCPPPRRVRRRVFISII